MALLLAAGCLNPQTTRMPRLNGDPLHDPRKEQASLEYYDPYPSRSLGPDTFSRPQGYNDQRSDTRRIREAQILRSINRDGQRTDPPTPTTQNNYPGVVRD